jgi:WD40 repeat protein
MRVFNIDELKLQREFTDFEPTNPIEKIKYSPNADILVACAKDGSVAIHNVQKQHQPTKMMSLQFKPPHVHVAFSPAFEVKVVKVHPAGRGQRVVEDDASIHQFQRESFLQEAESDQMSGSAQEQSSPD